MSEEDLDLGVLNKLLDRTLQNPLESFSFKGPDGRVHEKQLEFVGHVLAGHEIALSGANQSGKTQIGAALVVSLAEGRDMLGNYKLPQMLEPPVFWVLTQTYKQQVESTQKAILKWLGDWPHKIRYVPGQPESIQLLYVKPRNQPSQDHHRWAKIWFHVQATGDSLPGGRIDGVWADEPPDIACWEEATARGRGPGYPFYLMITYTPIKRLEWEPLAERFKDCWGRLEHNRIRIQASVYDNPWNTPEYIEHLKNLWRGQWDYDARLLGAEVDDTGQCPFTNSDQLKTAMTRWQSKVRAPRLEEFTVFQDSKEPIRAQVECFFDPHDFPEESWIGFVDPSLGINDAKHDPGGIHVYSRLNPRLFYRFHGFLEPVALGQLAGQLMQRCQGDPLDIEMNDNLGLQVMRGARDVGHDNFSVEMREDSTTGKMLTLYGWKTTRANRGGMIAAVQQLMLEDAVEIPSEGLISALRNVTVRPGGRVESRGRHHDEDMILLGRFGLVSRGLGVPLSRIRREDPARVRLMRLLGNRPREPLEEPDWIRDQT